jgi:ABC-type transport system involved in multi-copper enzyme maturation permease subunit
MMGRVIGLVAYHVFKESVRDKVLYNLVLFAVLLILASYVVGQLTAGQDIKIIKDLGLAASAVFGLFIAVFIGVGLVWKEVDRRSVYNLLVKPLRRHEFIVGKFLGLALTLLVNIAVMAISLYAVLAVMQWIHPGLARASVEAPVLDPQMLKAFVLLYVQLLVVTSVALFFSTFAGPMMSAAFTFGLYIVGHFNADLAHFETIVQNPAAAWAGKALYYVLPNLAPFDVKAAVVHGRAVPAAYVALTIGYGVLYVGAMIALAVAVFSRRDFK